jgi:hypothetical protein
MAAADAEVAPQMTVVLPDGWMKPGTGTTSKDHCEVAEQGGRREVEEQGVGEFRETRHPRNVEFNEILKVCFSGASNSRFSEVWDLRSLEFANVRGSGILIR